MPSLPAALAQRAERWFGHSAVVTAVDQLSPGLRRVTFAGAALAGRRYVPGHEVEFRVSARDFRHYTSSRFDSAAGELDVVFAAGATGPGEAWARGLTVGDEVAVMGPAGGVRWQEGGRLVLLGDATALGLFHALISAGSQSLVGAVEVPAEDHEAARLLTPGLDVLAPVDGPLFTPGDALRGWLADPPHLLDVSAIRWHLVGHTQTIQDLRATLRQRGVPRGSVVVKAHWATGRRGL